MGLVGALRWPARRPERYLNFVVDQFALRDDFQFGTRVVSGTSTTTTNLWTLQTTTGPPRRRAS